jgi:holliday junction DNA helicase RuvA
MIASVAGKVGARCPDHVVIESGGVGYRLNVSAQTLATVPAVGGDARLHAHLVARDDSLHLYGFATEEERDLFLKLVSVAGVGPKMALAVLSGSSAREVSKAIALGDAKRFQVVPGVGKRTAERIIVELREKISDDLIVVEAGVASDDPRVLAREGLVGLGYDATEAERMLDSVALSDEEREPEELITAALRTAVKGG